MTKVVWWCCSYFSFFFTFSFQTFRCNSSLCRNFLVTKLLAHLKRSKSLFHYYILKTCIRICTRTDYIDLFVCCNAQKSHCCFVRCQYYRVNIITSFLPNPLLVQYHLLSISLSLSLCCLVLTISLSISLVCYVSPFLSISLSV